MFSVKKIPQALMLWVRSGTFLRNIQASALRIASTIINLAFGILGARMLGPDIFGVYVSIFAVVGIVSVLTSAGFPALLQRELSVSRGNGDRSGLKPIIQGLAVVNVSIFLAFVVAVAFSSWIIALAMVFCLLGNLTSMLGSLFISHERVLISCLIGNVFRPAVALLGLLFLSRIVQPTALLPLVAQIAAMVITGIFMFFLWRGEPLSNARRAFVRPWWSEQHLGVVKTGVLFAGNQMLVNLMT